MLLYRPLGLPELKLVAKAGWRAWPPRLPHQPTFYPVLTFQYAQALALDASSRLPADVPPPLASKAPLRFGCPCCRSLTLNTRGKFERCAVCGWADDGQDDRDAELVHGGPNGSLSLSEARRNYAEFRACEQPAQGSVRPPAPDEM
jgi:hypothetical protein